MVEVKFFEEVNDELLKFAVIIAKSNGKWVLCKQKGSNTYECPGGHRDAKENITDTARRELWEETGALDFSLIPICVYSVIGQENKIHNEKETYGMLYYSEIKSFGQLPEFEIEKVELFDELPENWTYPSIQPKLLERLKEVQKIRKSGLDSAVRPEDALHIAEQSSQRKGVHGLSP